MTVERGPDWARVVRDNWHRTTAYLLASTRPCIEIRDDELDAVRDRRVLVGVGPKDLEDWSPSGSWMLAVILCPGDSTEHLAAWAKEHRIDETRVHFYLHPDTPWDVLKPWDDAGFPTDRVDDDVDSWKRLHRLFGLALNDRVAKDWWPKEG